MPSSTYNGPMRGSQFSRTNQGPQNRTLYNKSNDYIGEKPGKYGKDYDHRKYGKDYDRGKYGKDYDHEKYGKDYDHHDNDFRHKGIVRGDFYEHHRHFRFRRFFHGEWVFLNDWDDCTAWVWVHVAPGVWAWRPVDVCIG